jgi:hypothetical protein
VNKNGAQTSIQDDLFYTYADKITPRKLTIEQLKTLGGFGEISDSDALEIIDELYRLTIITYKIYKKEQWD